ncbi:IMPACT family protein [Sinomonas terrae]|uniref:IMPACT family protein n=1 Tax=Sinomonas terrae TaxID=2908838 RepID=A0ABS9U1X8_9MICC|nr:YigZ family protein [Sinomonas terrae]MCH6470507.1 IMPACT family protein [Sinomonas terrae]
MTSTASHAFRYSTVDGEHRHELEIKRSRFITVLRRAETEEAARSLVAELRREFHDARHHCSAFVLGPDRMTQRSNDDGEPSGTAGAPMLEALLKGSAVDGEADLSDVAAVVVRYFGGILLGAGGLVRAYSESVSRALATAPLIWRERLRLMSVEAPHGSAGRLENDLRAFGISVVGTDDGPTATSLRLAIEDAERAGAAFQERLATLTGGGCVAVDLETSWVDVP